MVKFITFLKTGKVYMIDLMYVKNLAGIDFQFGAEPSRGYEFRLGIKKKTIPRLK
jgi:hypothetical protein